MTSTPSRYLLYENFVEHRNAQDELLNREFSSVRREIQDSAKHVKEELRREIRVVKDDIRREIQVVKDDVGKFKDDVYRRFDHIEERFDGLELEYRRMSARVQNNNLRNPTLRINPVVAFRPGHGIVEPDRIHFPRHAREFYNLRDPKSRRQQQILAYLLRFYDVPCTTLALPPASSDDETSDSEESDLPESSPPSNISIQDVVRKYPAAAVDFLEGLLGLNEDNFDKFQEKAARQARRTPSPIVKRPLVRDQNDDQDSHPQKRTAPPPATVLRALDLPLREGGAAVERSSSSLGLDSARVGWRNSPPSAIARLAHEMQEEAEPELDRGSPTNGDTLSREHNPSLRSARS